MPTSARAVLSNSALSAPGLDRIEDMRLDAGQRGRHREAEILSVRKSALRSEPFSAPSIAPASPLIACGGRCRICHRSSRFDQPAIDAVLGDQVAQQIAVDRRVARQEGRAEAVEIPAAVLAQPRSVPATFAV